CLSRRIRAVGPMVLLFLLLGFAGTEILLGIVGSSYGVMRDAVTIGSELHLGGTETYYVASAVGFLAFTVVGAAMLIWIRRRYQAKQLSDESLTVFTVWALFAFSDLIGLTFDYALAPLAAVIAMAAFIAVARFALRRAAPQADGCKLLLLRSFTTGSRG